MSDGTAAGPADPAFTDHEGRFIASARASLEAAAVDPDAALS